MKKITKNSNGECAKLLQKLIKNYNPSLGDPYRDYLRSHQKKIIKTLLIQEQNGLCAYCENIINEHNSHLEHIIPRATANRNNINQYLNILLGYNNLIVSCQKTSHKHATCGHSKDITSSKELKFLLNPIIETPEKYLNFNLKGNIIPRESLTKSELNKAKYTISILNLNSLFKEENDYFNALPIARVNAKNALIKQINHLLKSYTKEEILDKINKIIPQYGFTSFCNWSLGGKLFINHNEKKE